MYTIKVALSRENFRHYWVLEKFHADAPFIFFLRSKERLFDRRTQKIWFVRPNDVNDHGKRKIFAYRQLEPSVPQVWEEREVNTITGNYQHPEEGNVLHGKLDEKSVLMLEIQKPRFNVGAEYAIVKPVE